MAKGLDRRHVARLPVPSQFSARGLALQPVRLIDLSPKGARIEHSDPLNEGLRCVIDLPPTLGRGTLSGRVVWIRLHHIEQSLEGKQQHYYRSGLAWNGLTPEQQGTLAAALELLKVAQEAPPPEGPAGAAGDRG